MKRFLNILIIAQLFFIISVNTTTAQSKSDTFSKVDSLIRSVRKTLQLKTGLSIAVVRNDKMIFSKAYGYSDVENNVKAKTSTPFYIASSTKSFTAELIKLLSDEGVVNIDEPINKYLPDLELPSPLSAKMISLRDLLTHRSGIENIAVILRTAFTGQHTNDELLKLFSKSEFSGIKYRYTNTDYVLASLAIEKQTGKSWKDLLKEKIFDPLEMKNTSAYVSYFPKDELPKNYTTLGGKLEKIDFDKTDKTMHAAGGIYSSADDLANWLIFNINRGKFKNTQIISPLSMDEIHSSQINFKQTFFKYKRFAYGLGWIRSDYNGNLLIHHFGSYTGSRSHISFMPEKNIGVVALTNDDGDAFYTVDLFADCIYNLLNNNPQTDSIAEAELSGILKDYYKEKAEAAKENPQSTYPENFKFSHYTGTYTSEEYGKMIIEEKENSLSIIWGNMNGNLIYQRFCFS